MPDAPVDTFPAPPAPSVPPAPSGATVVFHARNLCKTYQTGEVQVRALHDVNLDIVRGEFVVLLHPAPVPQDDDAAAERVLRLLLAELPTKTAVKLTADITNAPRNALYELALQIKRSEQD